MTTAYRIRITCPQHQAHTQTLTITTEGVLHREAKGADTWLTWLDNGHRQGIRAQVGGCCYAPRVRFLGSYEREGR